MKPATTVAPLVSWVRGQDPNDLLSQEWLVTNSIGGYASGTVRGIATRRYHGLFVPNLPAPRGRTVLIPRLDDSVKIGSSFIPLGGVDTVQDFKLVWQIPHWTFRVQDRVIEKRITMPSGQNTVYVQYSLLQGEPLELQIRPYFAYRGHDDPIIPAPVDTLAFTITKNGTEARSSPNATGVKMNVHPAHSLFIAAYRVDHVSYAVEKERGLDFQEAVSSPGYFNAPLKAGEPAALMATVEPWESLTPDVTKIFEAEEHRLKNVVGKCPDVRSDSLAAHLILAADQFIVSPSSRVEEKILGEAAGEPKRTVIAGYHWFTDWGRDTMISLEGLTLCTGRYSEGRAILKTFSTYVKNGLLPNLFPEGARTALYHTMDATLWYFHAADRYYHYTGDRATLEILFPVFQSIIESHLQGTDFGIGVDPGDGLLKGGANGTALTWMDAKVEDTVVTPRRGKPVEIQALWYNALCLMDEWSKEFQAPSDFYAALARRVSESFNRRFWNEPGGYLYDVVDGEKGDDSTFRPNQIFSISFRFPLLTRSRWRPVFDTVTDQLLTPYGLRTLATNAPNYRPRYEGNRWERDRAYHQGMVWTWLIGPYLDARRKVYPDATPNHVFLKTFETHLLQAGIGTISEIFDGEKPHLPRGCIAQAWSVAEVLRSLLA